MVTSMEKVCSFLVMGIDMRDITRTVNLKEKGHTLGITDLFIKEILKMDLGLVMEYGSMEHKNIKATT
jgi:hypothetical protein